jgi:hypothetical protein
LKKEILEPVAKSLPGEKELERRILEATSARKEA